MRSHTYIALILGLIFYCTDLSAQIIDKATLPERLSTAMEKHFGARNPGDPGGVLLVSIDGEEIYRHIFGLANLETGTPITDSTVFEAASVTKQFTAAAILTLIDEGRLSLDDDVRTYFPQLPDYGHTITIRHLLTHTSGLRDWRNVVYLTPWPTGECLYNEDFAVDLISHQRGINFTPGDQYRYTNAGYDLMGALIEQITDTSYADYIKTHLLDPAGMTRSQIRGLYSDIVKNRANGYLTSNGHYIQGSNLDETYGAAGLQTTAGDLQKWLAYIFSDKVSASVREMRLTQFVLNDGTEIPYANGGVEIHEHNGQMEVNHGGLISGYRAYTAYFPETKVAITYMSNDRQISSVGTSDAVADVIFGSGPEPYAEMKTITPTQALLEKTTGRYQSLSDHSNILDLNLKDGFILRYSDTARFVENDQFVLGKSLFKFTDQGLEEQTPEGTYTYKRVTPFSPDETSMAPLLGKYYSSDCDQEITLSVKDGKLISARAPYDTVRLYPMYKDGNTIAFRCINNGLRNIYLFTLEPGKKPDLKVSIPRADNIQFAKQ